MTASVEVGRIDRPAVLPVLVENLEELEFLSIQRRKLFCDFETTMPELAEHDERIEAHFDSLRIGAAASCDVALRALDEAVFPWEVFAAARTWLELAAPAPAEVLERIAPADPALLAGWREAFRRLPPAIVRTALPAPPEGAPDIARALHADAWGWHGLLPPTKWDTLAADASPLVREAAARTCGLDARAGDLATSLLDDGDVRVRRRALWSLALRDPTAAKARARAAATTDTPDEFALRVLGFVGSPRDVAILSRHAERSPAACRALGDLGDPQALDLLLRLFASENAAVVAGAMDGVLTIVAPPPPADDETEAYDPEVVRGVADERRAELSLGERYVRAQRFAAEPNSAEDLTELVWKRAILARAPSTESLRREVPDGFFDAAPLAVSVPGE